jgi:hypothetical protein
VGGLTSKPVAVALELGQKRVFASALDWPGWSRSGHTEEEALERLAAYAERYAAAVGETALRRGPTLEVVERFGGGSGTDFGVPSSTAAADERPLDDEELERQLRLLQAAWSAFDRAADGAQGRRLRTGPRGGGRDVGKMREHVDGAEEAYLSKLGSRAPREKDADERRRQVRERVAVAVRARVHGEPIEDPSRTQSLWTPRYFVRRAAWHALDHAWEIEDRMV